LAIVKNDIELWLAFKDGSERALAAASLRLVV
jgi:hypothetical protein